MRRDKREQHIAGLLEKLLVYNTRYFSRGYLNSDGRRILEEAIKHILEKHPEKKKLVARVRRNPSLENVLRLAEEFLGEEAHRILERSRRHPYRYRDEPGAGRLDI